MDLKRSWNLLKIHDLIIIALLVLSAYSMSLFGASILLSVVVIVMAAVLLDLAINYVKERKLLSPKSALITGLILSSIIEGPLWLLVAAAAIAILSKHIIRIKGRHIFNPANFALFVALFLPVSQSWWGTSNLLLVGILGLVVVFKLKRFHLALPFLAVHAIMMFVLLSFDLSQLSSHLLSGSIIFFAFYMLIEPVTSPAKMKGRVAFGILCGIFATILYVVWLPAMLVSALFFADLCVPFINKFFMPKRPQEVPTINQLE